MMENTPCFTSIRELALPFLRVGSMGHALLARLHDRVPGHHPSPVAPQLPAVDSTPPRA